MTPAATALPAALAAALASDPGSGLAPDREDRIVFDLAGITARLDHLGDELPGVAVRYAMKACPLDEVIAALAARGAGVDAASPNEIAQALRAGVPAARIHYGNTVKSDLNIADAHRMGITTFATDSAEDVAAIAAHAPGARVFVRLATDGRGALWGLSHKFGCPPRDAVRVLAAARAAGLRPAGVSVHVGSQQMTTEAWQDAFATITAVIGAAAREGIALDHVNLGGGLPALGYLDRRGLPLDPPVDKIFAVLRDGMAHCRLAAGHDLDFVVEPGRYLVADNAAIRAHVSRLATRRGPDGREQRWLYLSCGKFNGLYEMDQLQYPLVFPGHPDRAPRVPAVVAGPSCDSDDAFPYDQGLVQVPRGLASGDPVWVLSSGAYAISYMTRGFNGFDPLPYSFVGGPASGTGGSVAGKAAP